MKICYHNWRDHDLEFERNDGYGGALSVLSWAYAHYGNDLVYSCSFGAESLVLLQLMSEINPKAKVIFLDTHVHFQATYQTIDKVKTRFKDLDIRMIQPELSLKEQAERFGSNLWEKNPNQCCYYRKIKPLELELAKVSAWISGLRHEQSETRKHVQFVNRDERFQSIKICPLIHWSWDDVWSFIRKHDLPYNPLHEQGYPSIGCAPCTEQVLEGDDSRSGRWKGSNKTECGLHIDPSKG